MPYKAWGFGALLLGTATAAPTTARYRVDQTIEQMVDASALGGGEQRQRFTVSTYLTVTLTDTTGGKTVHAVVDSMRGDSTTPVPKAVLDSARGVALHGFVATGGRLDEVRPVRQTALAPQLTGAVRQLFPRVRPGVKAGDGWTDTTESAAPGDGGSMAIRRITTYKATGGDAQSGVKTTKIESQFTASVSGTQQTPNGPANIEGTGSGNEAFLLTPDGRYVSGTSTQNSKLTISGVGPKPLPVTLTESFTVSALK